MGEDKNSRVTVKHYRSSKSGALPEANALSYGEIAVGYAKGEESLFIKNSNDELVRCYMQPDYSDFITGEEFSPVSTAALNSVTKGTLGKVNGISLEESDVELDLSLIKIVDKLPTENILDNKIYLVPISGVSGDTTFKKWLYITDDTRWEYMGLVKSDIDLSGYLKITDANKKYVAKSENQNSSINTDKNGAMANFSDNGQAYLAVRPKTERFLMNIPYAAAAFGVKDDGTAAFSHKQYTTYNKDTGAYTGAKNTAILQFAGPVGLRYAKNTGSTNDVTEAMYKYVGVIDSPDEFQRVYSAKQVDDLLAGYQAQIDALKQAIMDLGGTIE